MWVDDGSYCVGGQAAELYTTQMEQYVKNKSGTKGQSSSGSGVVEALRTPDVGELYELAEGRQVDDVIGGEAEELAVAKDEDDSEDLSEEDDAMES